MPSEKFGHAAPGPFTVDGAIKRLELRCILRALAFHHRGRRKAIDAANTFGDTAENREFATARQSTVPDDRSAKRAVIVGVDEARRQRPAGGVQLAVGDGGIGWRNVAEMHDTVVFDQNVAGIGRRMAVAIDDARVADELAHHSANSSMSRSRISAPAARSAGAVYSSTLWLMPPTLGTKIMQAGQTAAMICAS